MRQIKFRGISTKTGKYVYGYYVPQCPMSSFPGIVDDDGFINEVELDSVAQLVGFDSNADEVYEGDILTYANGEWTAALGAYMRNSAALCHYNFKNATLKEANHGR